MRLCRAATQGRGGFRKGEKFSERQILVIQLMGGGGAESLVFLQRWHREPSCAAGEREGVEKKKKKKKGEAERREATGS